MTMLIFAILFANFLFVAPECTFPPELSGNWTTSTLGTLTFSSTQVGPVFSKDKTLTCDSNNGTTYVLRSPEYRVGPAELVDYTCIDLVKVGDTTFTYQERTAENPEENNDRKVIYFEGHEVDVADVCSIAASDSPGRYSFMMKQGTLSESVIELPHDVLGMYNVTLASCDNSVSLDTCNNTSRLDFNFSQCADSNSFTGEQIYNALYYTTNNDTAFVTVYLEEDDPDNINPFIPLSCLAMGDTSLTLAPGDCQEGQTSGSVSTPGVVMAITKVGECEMPATRAPTTPEGISQGTVPPPGGSSTAETVDNSTSSSYNSTTGSPSSATVGSPTSDTPRNVPTTLASILSLMLGIAMVAIVM